MVLIFDNKFKIWTANEKNISPKCLGNLSDLHEQPENPKARIILLEVRGGIDKKPEGKGHRTDTIPICNEIIKLQCEAFPIFYSDDTINEVNNILSHSDTDGIIVRINPGKIDGITNDKWQKLLESLASKGKNVMPNPKVMRTMGSKDSLIKIRHLEGGHSETKIYKDYDEWYSNFPINLTNKVVIKQNRGSTGEGIWVVDKKNPNEKTDLNTVLLLQEAKDNHKEEKTLGEFIQFCKKYFEGKDGLIIQQKFLNGIKKGEIRFNMIFDELVDIVHKIPEEGGFSATMYAGAKYISYPPNSVKFHKLINQLKKDLPHILSSLNLEKFDFPVIWTVDYIYDEEDNKYYIGEFNCSCVGIARQLNKLACKIAQASVNFILS